MIIEENELRTYITCPRKFRFSKNYEIPLRYKYFEYVLQYIISDSLRNNGLDPTLKYIKAYQLAAKDLNIPNEKLKEYLLVTASYINEIFHPDLLGSTVPLCSTIEDYYQHKQLSIKLKLNGIFINPVSQIIYIVTSSPFPDYHSVCNDYINDLKISTVRKELGSYIEDYEIKLLVFGITNTNKLIIVRRTLKQDAVHLELLDNLNNHYFPKILPCYRTCQFKTNCFG